MKVNEEPQFDPSDDEDASPETHNKLLKAVTQIYRKQRIDKPIRREPALQISEFNLSNKTADDGEKLIDVHDLVDVLDTRATHHEIKKKVKIMQKKSKPLPQPMEKLYADKLRRKLGYVSVRKQLNRWEATVQRNRAALQLTFPLERNEKVKETHDFMETFKEPTELEKQVAAILQLSDTAQEERQKEEKLFSLSLEEIIERRKMIARMRARESYRIAKAIRQNKIKSKKYHRILKREKIKKELKDFEILQKTNPEAALEKLEQIERARAEERISLRHRNTGQWARSRAIRAKYDTEARAQLAEQLAKSRDLTRKLQSTMDSSSEEEIDDKETGGEILRADPTNPWKSMTETGDNEIESFVEGFRHYQEEKKKEIQKENNLNSSVNGVQRSDVSEKENIQDDHGVDKETSEQTEYLVCDAVAKEQTNESQSMSQSFESEGEDNLECDAFGNEQTNESQSRSQSSESEDEDNLECDALANEQTNESQSMSQSSESKGEDLNLPEDHPINDGPNEDNHKNPTVTGNFARDEVDSNNSCLDEVTNDSKEAENVALTYSESNRTNTQFNVAENNRSLEKQNKSEHLSKISVKSNPSNKSKRTIIPSVLVRKNISPSKTETNNLTNENFANNLQFKKAFKIISSESDSKVQGGRKKKETALINKGKIKVKKHLNLINQSGKWEVSTVDERCNESSQEMSNDETFTETEISTIDNIFDTVEHKLKNSLSNHINELKSNLSTDSCEPKKIKKSKYHADLSLKPSVKRPDIDETLFEVANAGISTGENDIKTLTNIYASNKNPSKNESIENIDPHKFLPAKPQKLNSGQLDLVEDHDESDDEETADKRRKLNLEEAFADDDVIEEFRREKEENVEKSNPKDIDLSLPGWGHWAGCSMTPKAEKERKRKNRRLIIKFPKVPRKDDKRDYVVINEEVPNIFKKHMVHDLPFPFKSVRDYETSIRAPIGNTWVPQSAFMKLIQPTVLTKLGSIIEPMSETELAKFKKRKDN